MTFIYERVQLDDFERRARAFGRYDQLGGYDGLRALFRYYEDRAQETGEPIELDIVAICCDWTLYDDVTEAAEALGAQPDDFDFESERAALNWLRTKRDCEVLPLPDGRVLVSE